MISGRSIPDADFFAKYGVNVTDVDDISWYPVTDHLAYPAAGILTLNFFANGVGQGATSALNAGAGAKSFADTNLENNGSMPAPERALIVAIGIQVTPGVLPGVVGVDEALGAHYLNDVHQIGRSGYLFWKVGQKQILIDAPLNKFGNGDNEGLYVAPALATATAADLFNGISYAKFCGSAYGIVPVAIPSNQNFPLSLNWPALVPTPSTAIARIGVTLYGYRIRKAQ